MNLVLIVFLLSPFYARYKNCRHGRVRHSATKKHRTSKHDDDETAVKRGVVECRAHL